MRQLAILILISSSFLPAQDKTPEHKRGTVCWPLEFAGIVAGTTNDSQARRLLGTGVFRADEGHTGARYFLDRRRSTTLHIVEGVDKVVDEITVSQGISHKLNASEQRAAVTKWFDPQEGFGNWHSLHLGSSKNAVLENLGEPQKKISEDKWVYESTCACELPEYLTLTFGQGRITQLNLYAGE